MEDDNGKEEEEEEEGEDEVTEVLEIEDMTDGISFPNHHSAVHSIEQWCQKTLCPISKARFRKPQVKNNV